MDTGTVVTLACSIVGALFGILTVSIGWVGARVVVKQDELMAKLTDIKDDIHARITALETRLVRVETIWEAKK